MNDVVNIPALVKAAVQSIEPSATVILFGSRARGDFHAESDWDFLVLVDEVNWEKKKLLLHTVYEVELEVGEAVSLLIEEKEEWERHEILLLYQNVQKEGILIN